MKNYDQDILEFFCSRQLSQQYVLLCNKLRKDNQTTEQVARLKREYFYDDI